MYREQKSSTKLPNAVVNSVDSVPDKYICSIALAGEGQYFIAHPTWIWKSPDSVKEISQVSILVHLVHQKRMITCHCPVLFEESVVDLISLRFGNSKTVLQTLLTSPVDKSKWATFGNKEFPRGDVLAAVRLFRRVSSEKERFVEDFLIEEPVDVDAFPSGT